jgi:hypothetical protein
MSSFINCRGVRLFRRADSRKLTVVKFLESRGVKKLTTSKVLRLSQKLKQKNLKMAIP